MKTSKATLLRLKYSVAIYKSVFSENKVENIELRENRAKESEKETIDEL